MTDSHNGINKLDSAIYSMHVVGEYPIVCHAMFLKWGPAVPYCGLVHMLVQAVNDLYLMFSYIGIKLYY